MCSQGLTLVGRREVGSLLAWGLLTGSAMRVGETRNFTKECPPPPTGSKSCGPVDLRFDIQPMMYILRFCTLCLHFSGIRITSVSTMTHAALYKPRGSCTTGEHFFLASYSSRPSSCSLCSPMYIQRNKPGFICN